MIVESSDRKKEVLLYTYQELGAARVNMSSNNYRIFLLSHYFIQLSDGIKYRNCPDIEQRDLISEQRRLAQASRH